MIATVLSSIGLLCVCGYMYSKYRHRYWSSKGIETPPFKAFTGHVDKLFADDLIEWLNKEVYSLCRNGLCGLYEVFNPVLMVGDPEIIKSIMVKDFDHFADRRTMEFTSDRDKIMGDMLSVVNGDLWRSLRTIMTPTFTSGKLRSMFDIVCKKSDELVSECLNVAIKDSPLELKDYYSRFVLDAIGTCAFGFESNAIKDKNSIFAKRVALFSDFDDFSSKLKFGILMTFPSLFKALNLAVLPKEVSFFDDVVEQVLSSRRKGEKRGDFVDLLLEAQANEISSNKSSNIVLDDQKIASQCVLFIVAGWDTTATTLAFASYALAKNPEQQTRLRNELKQMVQEHGFTYQGIMESKLLEACLQETLRMYPPATMTERVCTKPYQVPGTNITIRKGDLVQIPIISIHFDEQYWPEPKRFNPDRFMPQNKENITNYTHLPFGVGPRSCIAMRFALMETKICLAKMVLSMNLDLAPGHEDLKIQSKAGLLASEAGVPLILSPLNEK